jgi:RND superfamily putative drug exporter
VKSIAATVGGHRSAWVVLFACLIALGLALAFVPRPSATSQANPATAGDSAHVAQWLAHIPSADTTNGIVVWTRTDDQALTSAQQTAVRARGAAVAALSPEPKVAWTQFSPDRTVILVLVPMRTESVLKDAPAVEHSLLSAARRGLPHGVRARLTGQIASLADNARATGGTADPTLGIWLLVLAAVLLILATRSIVLWLIPLILAGAAAMVATLASAAVTAAAGLPFVPRYSPLTFALALSVVTAFSLVFIIRLRRELGRGQERLSAAERTWLAKAPGILASGLILAIGAAVFLFAPDSRVRALALSAIIGIVIATLTVLLAVASGLALAGYRSLWLALAPTAGRAGKAAKPRERRSVLIAFVTAAILGVVMTGAAALVVQATAPGTDEQAIDARAAIDRAFIPGYENESVMMVPNSLKGDTSVLAPTTLAMNLPRAHAVTVGSSYRGFAALTAEFDIDPGSPAALHTIRTLRGLIAAKGGPTATAMVGGPDAAQLDRQNATLSELSTLLPVATLLMLALLYLIELTERRREL